MQIGVEVSRALDNKRVFVVDGDEVTRAALTFMLQDENETHELATMSQVFSRSLERHPDLILLGVATVREANVDIVGELAAKLPATRILMVADGPQDETARRCVQIGAHGILNKPFTVEGVRRKVDRLLGRHHSLGIAIEVR